MSGYGISDAYTKTEVDSAISSSVLTSGSTHSIDIVAADSTLLVDSVNGTLNATTLTGALPAIDGSALTGITATTLGGQNASYYLDYNNFTNTPSLFSGAFADLTSKPSTIAGYGITDAYTKTEVDAQISAPTGDLKGSVFGDDSALLVDGVNSKIVGPIDTNGGQARFSSLVSQYSDLASISPVTYHGMIIHVHSEGAWYGAHAGAWYKIADVVKDSTILANARNTAISVLQNDPNLSKKENFPIQKTFSTITRTSKVWSNIS